MKCFVPTEARVVAIMTVLCMFAELSSRETPFAPAWKGLQELPVRIRWQRSGVYSANIDGTLLRLPRNRALSLLSMANSGPSNAPPRINAAQQLPRILSRSDVHENA